MNHKLWTRVGARVLALSFVLAGATACGERLSDTSSKTPPAQAASPSAVVIGTAPAQPTGDPPGTTPVSGDANTNEMSKSVESSSMPLPGQPNDHSNVAPKPSQAPEGADALKSPAAAANANAGERTERTQ
jgi:hypothetical protein